MSKKVLCLLAASLSFNLHAAEPESCRTVRLAEVDTHTRKGYGVECGNVGALLKNLEFSLAMENQIMGAILDDKRQPEAAARDWLKANPQVLEQWLAGGRRGAAGGEGEPGAVGSLSPTLSLKGEGAVCC